MPCGVGEGTRARGGGSKGFGSGGVSGRGTGPRDGANFATCVVFLTFQKEENPGHPVPNIWAPGLVPVIPGAGYKTPWFQEPALGEGYETRLSDQHICRRHLFRR